MRGTLDLNGDSLYIQEILGNGEGNGLAFMWKAYLSDSPKEMASRWESRSRLGQARASYHLPESNLFFEEHSKLKFFTAIPIDVVF